MEATKSLYLSNYCRLCSEDNDNGIDLFSVNKESIELLAIVNKYLPIKVENDEKFPKFICPGCHIQLESMKLFIDLILKGQLNLKNMFQNQQERHYKEEKQKHLLEMALHNVNPKSSVESYTIQSDDSGDKFFIQILSDGPLFPPDHDLTLRVEGLEKPKRKRGRPPKLQSATNVEEKCIEELPTSDNIQKDEFVDDDGRRKRKIKAPVKYDGIVQGDELDNILKKEGILDDDIVPNDLFCIEKGETIIVGRTEGKDGEDLGQPVFFQPSKMRSKLGYLKKKSKKKFECDICSKEFFNHGQYELHKKNHECSGDFGFGNNESVTNQHQVETVQHGELVTETMDMDKDADSKPVEISESPITNSTTLNFPCGVCNKSFSSKQNLDVHNRAVHQRERPFQCPKCHQTFAYASTLKCHLLKHDKDSNGAKEFPCETCGKVFQHPSSLTYHRDSEHTLGTRFVCTRCDKVFKHRQLLLRHQLVHTEKRPYVCKKCNATFKSHANLANHENVHSGVRKYVCKDCGQRYSHRTSLTLHQRWHDGKKPYTCEYCEKSFSQKGNLVEHQRIHTGEKPYCCEECGMSFTTSSQFHTHKKRHSGDKPWTCNFCFKNFRHADTFKSHVNRHLEHRPYRCHACDRAFTEPWSLKRHQRTHTGERPYQCDRCDKRFADSSNRCKHMRQHLQADAADRADGAERPAADAERTNEALEIRHLIDHHGNPISITTHDGKTVPVVTVGDDEESIQGLMPDGTLLPIEIANGPAKEESSIEESIMLKTHTGVVQVNGGDLDSNIFVTDDSGQGVCLVYAMEENNEVDQQLAIDPLLIQSR